MRHCRGTRCSFATTVSAGRRLDCHAATAAPIAAAPAPAIAEVPDLEALMRLPQDEMTPIVERFVSAAAGRADAAPGAGPGNAAGGRAATNSPGSGRPKQYYIDWLAALKTLDFDALSRNAQVDYLFIKSASERYLARADVTLDPNPPRKTDSSGITGAARGRAGLLQDLADEMIPYTPEQLIALAEKEFAWCDARDAQGVAARWASATTGSRRSRRSKACTSRPAASLRSSATCCSKRSTTCATKDLITVPQIASESLHMSMMTPEAQLVNPFFLGGAQISVSYPTNTMEYDARLQSMRGNNIPLLARDGVPRDDPRAQPGRLHGRALRRLSRADRRQHAVLQARAGRSTGS